MIYVIDLDDTICEPNHNGENTHDKYVLAKPIEKTITKINKLYEEGNKIIIHSARRMITHDGDIDKIENDVRVITEEWLIENNVKYHELIFGKPYGDFYIDDKGVSLNDFIN